MFFRIFGFCGVCFGLFKAAMALLRGETVGDAAIVGVLTGLFFGLTMAASLTAMQRWALKRRGMNP